MNYLIQRGKVRGQVINVPDGLPELLSDITREVLRCQPTTECLCQFIIDYLHSIIVARDNARAAKYAIDTALKQVDEIIADLCICTLSKENSESVAALMEETFKRFLQKYRCEKHREKEIVSYQNLDMLDELIKRCKFSEEQLKISRPLIEEAYNRFVQAYMAVAETTGGTEALYEYFREHERMRTRSKLMSDAAIKIQANFRGFITRRNMFMRMPSQPEPGFTKEPDALSVQKSMTSQAVPSMTSQVVSELKDACSIKSAVTVDVDLTPAIVMTGAVGDARMIPASEAAPQATEPETEPTSAPPDIVIVPPSTPPEMVDEPQAAPAAEPEPVAVPDETQPQPVPERDEAEAGVPATEEFAATEPAEEPGAQLVAEEVTDAEPGGPPAQPAVVEVPDDEAAAPQGTAEPVAEGEPDPAAATAAPEARTSSAAVAGQPNEEAPDTA